MDYDYYEDTDDKPKNEKKDLVEEDVDEEQEEEEEQEKEHVLYTLGDYEEEEEEEEVEPEFYEISAKLTIRLKQTFEYFDREKHAFLPTKMIGTLMRFVGFTPTESEIKDAVNYLRIDPRGTFDFQKFFQIIQMIARDPEPDEDILQAFSVLDEDDKGFIPVMEFREALMTQGDKLKEEEMVEFMKIADKKKNGKVKYENLLVQIKKLLKKMPPILECDQPPPPDPKAKLKGAAVKKK